MALKSLGEEGEGVGVAVEGDGIGVGVDCGKGVGETLTGCVAGSDGDKYRRL